MTADGKTERLAVVLFNLGGPDSLETVQPFLFNLFNDPAIIALPRILRTPLAHLIARRRAPIAREIYARMGGKSPIVPLTEAQVMALRERLQSTGRFGAVEVFPVMRYWHPRAEEIVDKVKAFGPDRIVLLPLYPQYSTTTSASSIKEWNVAARARGLMASARILCCSPTQPALIAAHAELLKTGLAEAGEGPVRVLFSAHGLPERTIARGDPYQWQVERTCAQVVEKLGHENLDWVTCYQSRVGPMKWIGPATDEEIRRAGKDGKSIVLSPIAFVSEHSETLVELDIEYRRLAEESGVPVYVRVPALGTHPGYIESLAQGVFTALQSDGTCSHTGGRICPAKFGRCAMAADGVTMPVRTGL